MDDGTGRGFDPVVRWDGRAARLSVVCGSVERANEMQRLFAGTPWDKPPTCARCGMLESECACPLDSAGPIRLAPASQTARLRREKRVKGKLVTVIGGLDPAGNDLPDLASRLKSRIGAGGTVKDGQVELQGDHLDAAEAALHALGYKTTRK